MMLMSEYDDAHVDAMLMLNMQSNTRSVIVNIMAKVTYENLLGGPLLPTFVRLQMVDQMIRFPEGLERDILVKVQDKYVPASFIILDMGADNELPIILGRPFLNTVNAVIYMGSSQIHLQFPGTKVKCPFNGCKSNM